MLSIVIDTSVVIAGIRSKHGASRQLLRQVLSGEYEPVFGDELWYEYLSVASREDVLPHIPYGYVRVILDGLASVGRWVEIHYDWRPNLRDESDNHLIELALAAGSAVLVTHNIRDLRKGELDFKSIHVCTPGQLIGS